MKTKINLMIGSIIVLVIAVVILSVMLFTNNGGTVVKTKSGNVSQTELYDYLKDTGGAAAVESLTFKKILEDKFGDKVKQAALDAKVKELEKQYGGKDALLSALTQNGITSIDAYKDTLRTQALVNEAAREYVKPSTKELKEFYDKTWNPDFTISKIAVADKASAEKIAKKLKDGGDFAKLAKSDSQDTATAPNGGKAEPLSVTAAEAAYGDMFKDVYKLKEGAVSAPIKTSSGTYEIIKMDKKPAKTTFDKDKKAVTEAYYAAKVTSDTQAAALKKLYKSSDVTVKDSAFKDVFASYKEDTKKSK
ncbi:hypothetical protein BFR40_06555 [Brochothrix thermosphacta]|uniref:peptidylprolyl isomerase n=1 Tax=Brochothrix thermosphacta TaxID=2756 RepID=UPI00083F5EA2|nr:peptidylprolyl isomerase [Brochothrix thermosphacta]ODJ51660.1 hypothetical protein BFR40_06555 [Brochothrix thermosphacta]